MLPLKIYEFMKNIQLELNKTDYEEKIMYFKECNAIIVNKDEIKIYLKESNIESWLKKVKKIDNNNFYLLIGQSNTLINKKIIKVNIPGFQPLTPNQIQMANTVWPSIYKTKNIIKENFINKDSIFNILMELNIDNAIACAHNCIIIDTMGQIHRFLNKVHIIREAISIISKNNQNGYICTGMDCILDIEPCYSCAMALVHGRIKNVIIKHKRFNGIFSKEKFNYNKNINHRFLVYFQINN